MTMPNNNDIKYFTDAPTHTTYIFVTSWRNENGCLFKIPESQCTVIQLLITTLQVIMSNKMTLLGWKLRKQFVLLKNYSFLKPWFL